MLDKGYLRAHGYRGYYSYERTDKGWRALGEFRKAATHAMKDATGKAPYG